MTSLIARYGILGLINLIVDVLISRFLFRGVRIIRRPFYIKSKRCIKIGKNFTAGVGLKLDVVEIKEKICIEIGADVQVYDYIHIGAADSVKIGNGVFLGGKVFITDHNHGYYGVDGIHDNPCTSLWDRPLSHASVVIEDDVWIGESSCVLQGVRIGRGSVIGSLSVVTKDIPPFCIAVGSPARVIKRYNFSTKRWEKA